MTSHPFEDEADTGKVKPTLSYRPKLKMTSYIDVRMKPTPLGFEPTTTRRAKLKMNSDQSGNGSWTKPSMTSHSREADCATREDAQARYAFQFMGQTFFFKKKNWN